MLAEFPEKQKRFGLVTTTTTQWGPFSLKKWDNQDKRRKETGDICQVH